MSRSALNGPVSLKRHVVHRAQRLLVNPVGRQLPGMVSEHGEQSDHVRNIKANPAVRVRTGGRWRSGNAHVLPGDDPVRRLGNLPRLNSAVVRPMGSDLLTVRVDPD